MTYLFYRYPNLEATIGLATSGCRASIVLLATGNSRSGKAGEYTYTRRNPDKRKAAERLAYDICNREYVDADGLKATDFVEHKTRSGKSDQAPQECSGSIESIIKAHRAGGNHAFHVCLTLPTQLTPDQLAEWLALEPPQNRPVKARWF